MRLLAKLPSRAVPQTEIFQQRRNDFLSDVRHRRGHVERPAKLWFWPERLCFHSQSTFIHRQLSALLLLSEKGKQRFSRMKSLWDVVSDSIVGLRNFGSFIQIREERNEQEKKENVPRRRIEEKTSEVGVLSDDKMGKKDKENNWLET